MISLTCNNADFYDTSTISGQKENKKEKQTTEGEVGQSSVTEEQLTFLTKFYDENIQRASGYICECIEHMARADGLSDFLKDIFH